MNIGEIKRIAKEKMEGKKLKLWAGILVTCLISGALNGLVQTEESVLISFIVTFALYPMQIGLVKYSLNLYRGQNVDIMDLFSEYKNSKTIIITMFLMALIVMCGYMLFIVPGIIWMFSYIIVQYMLAEGIQEKPLEILKKSKEMMKGYKMDYFLLIFSFFGWFILGIFTFGILYIWLIPYVTFAEIEFYEQIKLKQNTKVI